MKPLYRNLFLAVGVAAILVMLCTSDISYEEMWENVRRAGYWFPAVIVLWVFLYMANAWSWSVILNDGAAPKVSFWRVYKYTISGYALNYVTPVGLLGGEPYRVMALKPKIGTERATSSVILYAMTHIFSHFIFWLLSILLYLLTQPLSVFTGVLLVAAGAFCSLGVWFFLKGYRDGMAARLMRLARHIPGLKRRASRFIEKYKEQLATIDSQIAALHGQNPKTFVAAVLLELSCRFCSALEIMFILLVLPGVSATFAQCVLILAFTSLFANLLFFLPLQLGGREGGFVMSAAGLSLTAGAGIFVALIVRLRELVWTAIGLLLIKMERKRT